MVQDYFGSAWPFGLTGQTVVMNLMLKSFSTASQLRTHIGYRPDVDGLRAVAVIAVVLFHAFPKGLKAGFIGVDIFFVISGFLISSLIFKGMSENSFSVINFYARRIKRIVPALILILITCLVAGWFVLLPEEYKNLARHVSAGSLFVSNFWLWREAGYFDAAAEFKPLLHLWSLGVEEQFYLIWPTAVYFCIRLNINVLWPIAAIMLVSFGLNAGLIGEHPVLTFYFPITRFWQLMVGSSLAYLYYRMPLVAGGSDKSDRLQEIDRLLSANPNALAFIGSALIVAALLVIDNNHAYPGVWALLPTMGAFFVIAAGPRAWINRDLLSHPWLVFIGLISYPLYLWHWPLLSLARTIEGGSLAPGFIVSAVLLSVLLAYATYRFFERPVRASTGLVIPAILCGILAVLAVVGQVIYKKEGIAARMTALEFPVERHLPSVPEVDQCRKQMPFALGLCITYPTQLDPKAPTVLSIGDSHGGYLARGIYSDLTSNIVHIQFAALSAGSCLPFIGVERYALTRSLDCQDIMSPALKFAVDTPAIKAVMLVGRYALYTTGNGFGVDGNRAVGENHIQPSGPLLPPTAVNYRDVFEKGLRDTLTLLTKAGKKVIFIQQVPEIGFDPKRCIRPFRLTGAIDCGIDRKIVEERQQLYRQTAKAVLADFPSVIVIDPLDYFCDKSVCVGMRGGQLMYRDHHHLNAKGTEFLAEKIIPHLTRALTSGPQDGR